MSDVHDFKYYTTCMMGGILACGLTHAAICPIDIVKCRKQVREFSFFLTKLIFYLGQPKDVLEHWRRLRQDHGR